MIKERTLTIKASLIKEMIDHLETDLPNEGCGYISGTNDELKNLIKMTNVDQSPEHFTFNPKEQFAAVKEARNKKEELLAVYHSHPETPARLSEEDLKLFNDSKMAYIIVSFKDEKPDVKAYMVNKPSSEELEVRRLTLDIT